MLDFALIAIWLCLVFGRWNVLRRLKLEQDALVFVQHSLEEVAENANVPNHVTQVHLFIQSLTAFQEKEHLSRIVTLHSQTLAFSQNTQAGHHTDNARGLEVEVDFALTQHFHH